MKKMDSFARWGTVGIVALIIAIAFVSATWLHIPKPVACAIGGSVAMVGCLGISCIGWLRYRKTASQEEAACPNTDSGAGQEVEFARYQMRMRKKLINTPVSVWSLLAGIPTGALMVYLLTTTINNQHSLLYMLAVLGVVGTVDYVGFLIIYLRAHRLYRKAVRDYEAAHPEMRIDHAQPTMRGDEAPRGPATVEARQATGVQMATPLEGRGFGQQPARVKCPFCANTDFQVREEAGVRRCSECGSVMPSYIRPR